MCSLYFTSNCRYRVINKIHPCLSHANSFFSCCLRERLGRRDGCGLVGCSPQSLTDGTPVFLVFLKKSLVCGAGAVPSPHRPTSYVRWRQRRTLRTQPQHRGVPESLLEDVEDDARPGCGQGSPGNMMHRRVSHRAEASSAEIRQAVLSDRAQRRRGSSPAAHGAARKQREKQGARPVSIQLLASSSDAKAKVKLSSCEPLETSPHHGTG
jgi:hypothetical protein